MICLGMIESSPSTASRENCALLGDRMRTLAAILNAMELPLSVMPAQILEAVAICLHTDHHARV